MIRRKDGPTSLSQFAEMDVNIVYCGHRLPTGDGAVFVETVGIDQFGIKRIIDSDLLDPRLDVRRYREGLDPMDWGYGKHPDQLHVIARHHRLQLSIAMLCDAIGPERAVSIHEDFMYRHIAELKDPPRFHGSYRNCDMDKTLCWTISKDQVIK